MKVPFWRQPLLHFLLAGAAIFLLGALRGDPEAVRNERIVVTAPQVERIAGLWQRTWGRPPSETELQALVRDHIKEEVYYREALKLGLDVNDTVIRRRLRQKMEFFATDAAGLAAPDEATLRGWFASNADRYRIGPQFDFQQVYLAAPDDAGTGRLLRALRDGSDPGSLGDTIDLPVEMAAAARIEITRVFGSAFFESLDSMPVGAWSGPVESGFGWHLVRVQRKTPAEVPRFDAVRRRIENDWHADQARQVLDESFEELLAQYDVDVEVPSQ